MRSKSPFTGFVTSMIKINIFILQSVFHSNMLQFKSYNKKSYIDRRQIVNNSTSSHSFIYNPQPLDVKYLFL